MLTELRPADAHALLSSDRDAETAARFDWDPSAATLERCQAYIRLTRERWQDGQRAAFAVRERGAGPLIGTVEARREADGHVELSWMTVPAHRGQRVASRAVRAVCQWCRAGGVHVICASVERDNESSLAVARSAGLRERGRDGRWVRLRSD